jgi:hypothetical protein
MNTTRGSGGLQLAPRGRRSGFDDDGGEDAELGSDQLLHGRYALLRRGKKHLAAVVVEA